MIQKSDNKIIKQAEEIKELFFSLQVEFSPAMHEYTSRYLGGGSISDRVSLAIHDLNHAQNKEERLKFSNRLIDAYSYAVSQSYLKAGNNVFFQLTESKKQLDQLRLENDKLSSELDNETEVKEFLEKRVNLYEKHYLTLKDLPDDTFQGDVGHD